MTTVTFDDWFAPPGDNYSRCPRFLVHRGGSVFGVVVMLSGTGGAMLAAQLGLPSPHDAAAMQILDKPLLEFGVRRIERSVVDGVWDDVSSGVVELRVLDSDFAFLQELIELKTCNYQVPEGPDLYCSAAGMNDETVVGSLGLRRLAPTSRPTCLKCDLPDTDYICTHLVHPSVTGPRMLGTGSIPARGVREAACDLDRPEIQRPSLCRPGENPCWERAVRVERAAVGVRYPPGALAEALDSLDTSWRLAFDNESIIQLRNASEIVGLGLNCTSLEEFKSRVSELSDLVKNFEVAAELLPDGESVPRDQTLRRLRAALEPRVEPEELPTVVEAIADLQAINRIRVGYQHAGAADELPTHYDRLGIASPSSDWEDTWDAVRARATAAIQTLARAARNIALRN